LKETLLFLHGYGARVLIAFAIVLGVWGAYHYFRTHELSGGFRSTYLIMAVLIPIQGLLGLGGLASGGDPRILHIVYGVFATLFVPGAYLYARGSDKRREALVLAGASWIVAIAFFRGIATG
jgi:CDP-diglyceride synthetase